MLMYDGLHGSAAANQDTKSHTAASKTIERWTAKSH